MVSIQETAYPRLKVNLSRKVLENCFCPTAEEIAFANKSCRKETNRICFLALLKTFQHLGYFLQLTQIPGSILNTVAQSIGYLFLPDDISQNYDRSGSKSRHMRVIRNYLKVKPVGPQTYLQMRLAAKEASQTKEYLIDIINVMIEEMIRQRFELPAFNRFVREAGAARLVINQETCERISGALSLEQKQMIDQLLDFSDEEGESWWQEMKTDPPAPTVKNTRLYAQHVENIKQYYDSLHVPTELPEAKRTQFYYEAYAADLGHLRSFSPSKRYAFVILLLEKQLSQALDAITHIFIRRMRKLHNDAKKLLDDFQKQNQKQAFALIAHLARITAAFQTPGTPLEKFEAMVLVMPSDPKLITEQCYQHLAYAEDNYRICMLPKYTGKRSILFDCLSSLELHPASQDNTLLKALDFVFQYRKSRKEWVSILDEETGELSLDLDWITDPWRKLVTGKAAKNSAIDQIHRKNFELCVFSELDRQLNSGDIFITGSGEFSDFRTQQISLEEYDKRIPEFEALSGIPTDGEAFVKKLKSELIAMAKEVDVAFPGNPNARIQKGEIILRRPTKKKTHKDYPEIDKLLKQRMKPLNILDVLIHSEKWLKLSKNFQTLSGRGSKMNNYSSKLVSTLFCYGCFMGPTQTARSVRGINRKQLAWINSHHITEERLNKATTKVINAYQHFSLPKYWGSGKSVSADGTQWEMYEQNLMAQYHIRYGRYGGIGYYHVSDNYIALFSHFIPCGVREAVYILDGLTKNMSDIKPDTVHGDSHSQNTVAFGLAHLLGIKLMPRIKNIKDLTLFRPDEEISFDNIDELFTDKINWKLIQTHLPDMLRVVLSIMAGKIIPSTILTWPIP
ncbi:MAG: Tn3 family transposase [Bacteroidota bacterium]